MRGREKRGGRGVLADSLDGEVGEGVRGIVVWIGWRRERLVIEREAAVARGLEEAGGTGQQAVEAIKAAFERPFRFVPLAKMPLSCEVSAIADGSKGLGNGDTAGIEVAEITVGMRSGVSDRFLGEATQAGLVRVQAGEEGSAGG